MNSPWTILQVKKYSCPFEEVDDLNIRELGLSEIKTWKCHKILGHDGWFILQHVYTAALTACNFGPALLIFL